MSATRVCAKIVSVIFMATLVGPVAATTITFKDGGLVQSSDSVIVIPNYNGTEDTTRSQAKPNHNYGGWIDWSVGTDSTNGDTDGLIRFDVSAMAGQYVQINSITLRMFNYTGGQTGIFANTPSRYVDVFVVAASDDDWVEGSGPGPNGAPQFGSASYLERRAGMGTPWSVDQLAADNVVVAAPGGMYKDFALDANLVNLTSLINTWSSVSQNAGLRVALDSYGSPDRQFLFGSQDNPTGIEGTPELVIDYTPVPEPGAACLLGFGLLAVLRRRK